MDYSKIKGATFVRFKKNECFVYDEILIKQRGFHYGTDISKSRLDMASRRGRKG